MLICYLIYSFLSKPENIFVKNNLYKLGDFGLANVFSKNDGNSAPDIEEGDSRYMSKDLLDFNPKDLTKVCGSIVQ